MGPPFLLALPRTRASSRAGMYALEESPPIRSVRWHLADGSTVEDTGPRIEDVLAA